MEAFHPTLLAWFDAHKRDLPWRGVRDPYGVWISEVMLQQTRASTVVPYYRRWMERFPDVGAFADADVDEVLRLWKGLGYYARARNAHQAARIIRDAHGGIFPSSDAGLRTLPGIGPYTGAAVASIAFGEAAPAVDGNVRRVVARLFDRPDPSLAEVRSRVGGLMDPGRPGDFNEAMMELGATVCTPRSPSCEVCPLAGSCRARGAGTVADRPVRRRRGPVPTRTWGVLVAVSPGGRTLLVRRPPKGLLGGMWEFPAVEAAGEKDILALVVQRARPPMPSAVATVNDGRTAEPVPRAMQVAEPEAIPVLTLAPVTHQFSHFTGVYRPVRVEVGSEWPEMAGRWVSPRELADMALPVAQQRIAQAAEFDGPPILAVRFRSEAVAPSRRDG